ncbi:MAG: TolC family protein [Gemmatimonadaceae bacterium]|nr:TolC family protein [Gemmatimonadaceae bacterium]
MSCSPVAPARRRALVAAVAFIVASAASASSVPGQPPPGVPASRAEGASSDRESGKSPLDALVESGLRQNLGRRQQVIAVQRAEAAVREARGRWLPSATFNSRYSRYSGNTINMGTLINPAFDALNQLLQRPAFPTNIDMSLPMRTETTVRVSQAVFQPAILAAHRAQSALADAQVAQRDVQARQLAADIKSGYLTYAKVRQVVTLYDSTLLLLDEQVRVSERLVQAGKATPDMILRARAERSEVQQRRDESVQLADASREALNLLLNRPLSDEVAFIAEHDLGFDSLPALDGLRRAAATGREELRQVDHARRAVSAQERLAQGSFLPSVSVALDYGVQGKEYRFDRSRDFSALSFVVTWNLFNGGQDAARIEQAALDARRLAVQREELQRLIALDVTTAWQSAAVARSGVRTAEDRLQSARRTFELVRRKQEEGAASQLEFLDARTTFTTAALNLVITRYDYYLRRVALERAAASYDLAAATNAAGRP